MFQCRCGLVVKHRLGKTESAGPIPASGSRKNRVFSMGIGRRSGHQLIGVGHESGSRNFVSGGEQNIVDHSRQRLINNKLKYMSQEGIPNNEDVKAELAEKKSLVYKDMEKYELLVEFANQLKVKYPDYLDYDLFHFLVGSTPVPDKMPTKFDFPGEDSIEFFLRSI